MTLGPAPAAVAGALRRPGDLAWTLLVLFLVVASATMLALAVCGWFHWALVLAVALPSSGAAALVCQRQRVLLDSGGVWRFLLAAVLAAPLYAHPHEYLIGWDPGVYLNTGAMLARSGGLTLHETPTWRELSPEEKVLFHHRRPVRNDGFRDGAAPNFLHLYPAWVAFFIQAAGPGAGLWVNPLFGLLAPLLVFALVLALTRERSIAWITALLLLLNVNHIYFARFSTAEMVGASALAAAIIVILHGWRRNSMFWFTLGGPALVLTAAAKIDALPFIVLFLACLTVAAALRSDPRIRRLGGSTLLSLAFLFLYYRLQAWEYVQRVLGMYGAGVGVVAGAAGLVAASFLFVAFAVRLPARSNLAAALRRGGRYWRVAGSGSLPLALLAAAGIGIYRIRAAGQVALWDRWAIFAWVFTPIGVLLLAAGCLLWLRRGAPTAGARVGTWAAAVVVTIVTMSDPVWGSEPLHFWISRRLELVLIPLCCLFIATAVVRLAGAFPGGRLLAAGLLLLVIATPLRAASAWLGKGDQAGLLSLSRRLAAQFEPGDIVVCDIGWMASPLRFFWGVETFALQLDRDPAAVLAVVDRWIARGRRVYFLGTGEPVYHPERTFALRSRADFTLESLERLKGRLPRAWKAETVTVRLYEILPTPPPAAVVRAPLRIAVGNNLFGLGGGFDPPKYFTLESQRVFARNCRGRCVVHLPLPPAAQTPWLLRLRVDDLRAAPRAALQVRLTLDGSDMGVRGVAPGAQDLEFALPEARSTPAPGVGRLTLEFSDTGADGAPRLPAAAVVESVLLTH